MHLKNILQTLHITFLQLDKPALQAFQIAEAAVLASSVNKPVALIVSGDVITGV
jgi:hypothetical protein